MFIGRSAVSGFGLWALAWACGLLHILPNDWRQISLRLLRHQLRPRHERGCQSGRAPTRALAGYERRDGVRDHFLRGARVLIQVRDDELECDRVVLGMPAVVVRHEGD